MSGSQNANTTLVEVRSEDTVGLRRAAQALAVTVLAALFAIQAASATETTQPWQPVQTKPAVHALVLRGQALNRIYHLGPYAHTSPAKAEASQAVHALMLRGQALNRIYHLGPYAHTSPAKVEASTVLKPTAVKIAANRTGGSMNKVQQLFSIH
jgi:hypothetical protein